VRLPISPHPQGGKCSSFNKTKNNFLKFYEDTFEYVQRWRFVEMHVSEVGDLCADNN
jgi:hypothetical protein